ncbi:hypothetical protein [Mucilaginibacter sp.]|uniref:hypothetical protein n=1 Tax=Mucilaginibacter sp. TaxID=1882438 RepID=UPI00283EEC89|nr:hypothetical protein [Mucilaginibacter sp.]MDR3696362.1 hypothetical protein [Mucilaginibacter sp.]
MARYKTTYSKSTGLFSSTRWHCYIYDRKDEAEYSGMGNTKKEARDDAWDSVYSKNSVSSYSGSEPTSSGKSNDFITTSFVFGGFGLFLAFVVGLFKGCGLFYYDVHDPGSLYLFSIDDAVKGFWMLPVGGFIIGLFVALIHALRIKNK